MKIETSNWIRKNELREKESYGLSFVPSKAFVNVKGESAGEVDCSDAESCCECLESVIPNLTSYAHFRSATQTRFCFPRSLVLMILFK